ncbi:MAG: type II secretion system protein M [Gammaproteobacteria bacterium]|nr:type II secretion system protein M [Gammaproteobacteria bacterium]
MAAKRLTVLATRIDTLSLRERGILLAVALLVLYAVCNQLFIAPTLHSLQQKRGEITTLQTQLTALQTRAGLLGQNAQDPLAQRNARITELETQLAAQDAQFEAQLGRLVRPQQAAALLRDVLEQSPGLRLLGLDSAPGAPLLPDSARSVRIVRYDLKLRVEGGYLAALEYLQRLEQLPWTLFWDGLSLEARAYPRNEIQVSVYTLGQQP